MSDQRIQTSFASGELAPSLFARVDLAKYKSGAALLRNFFVDYRSGASTRTGTEFVIQCLVSNKRVRLIEFQYSVLTTYVLEFGDFYIRFITDGGAVLEDPFAISAANNGNPGQIAVIGHNYVNGDWLFIDGVVGAVGYNNRFVSVTVSGDVLTLYDVNGNPINAAAFGTYLSGGTTARVYKIASPYAAEDLDLIKFVQSASVLTLVHPDYVPYNLSRVAAANWTLTPISFATSAATPAGVACTASAVGTSNYSYIVTALDADGQESLPSTPGIMANAVNVSTTQGTIHVTWTAAANAASYNIYKAQISNGAAVPSGVAHGYVGNVTGLAFDDSNIVPDFLTTPPIASDPFDNGNHPGTVGFFEQREVFAAPTANPLTFYMSQPGAFNNFNYSHPIQEDDSIEGTLVSTQVNAIKAMVAMPGGLVMLTARGSWQVNGGGADTAITPINAKATPQAFNGASDVRPLVSNSNILFVQEKGSIVRDLSYNIYGNIYTGMDISVLSNHLFYGYTITEWTYSEEPFKIVHAVRDDGVMLALTYVKEQEIYGWTHYDTLGTFQSVASITEGEVDAVYTIVKRYIGGQWLQFIERFADRTFEYGAEDAWNVDCGVRSTLPEPAAGLTASAATGSCTFNADAAVFSSADVDKVLRMGGGIANITTFVTPTQVIGTLIRDIRKLLPNASTPTPLPALAGEWTLTSPATVFSGLDHLNGQTVSILADGGVVTPQVVVAGAITLAQSATKVNVGLGFTAQLQTMYLDIGEPTIQGKRKKISALTMRVADTRGLYAGTTFETLVPNKELNQATILNRPSELITSDQRVIMDPSWNEFGQICIQITDPLPATILGVIPEITIGDK